VSSEATRRLAPAAGGLGRLTFAVTLLALLTLALRDVMDPDLWWHMATGRYIVTHGQVPAYDVFSFTAQTHRWVTHEWLSDLLLYGGYRLLGLTGLALVFALVITLAYALVFLRCPARPVVAGCAVLAAALASVATYGVRPQMLSLLFASLFLYILDGARMAPRRVWLLVPLTLLWANLHSGFVAGLAIIGVYAVGEELSWLGAREGQVPWLAPTSKRLALVLLSSLAASLVTPNGISAVAFPFGTLSNRLIQDNIGEWASPDFHDAISWPLAAFWLSLLAVLALSRRRPSATQLLLLLGASAAALYSIRHVQFLSLVGAPILAAGVESIWGGTVHERPVAPVVRRGLWLVVVALTVVIAVRIQRLPGRTAEVERTIYPSAALDYMRERGIGGRVFNTYHWGGYLIWRGYPVFIDGRAEVYGDEVLGDWLSVRSLKPDWEALLQRYDVEVVLLETDSPLAVVLEGSGRWQPVYRDDLATVFLPAGTGAPGG
jgi:hypothetical protein